MTDTQYLYRHFDSEGCLLYVGVTSCLEARLIQHKASSKWFDVTDYTETVEYSSRAEAEAAEKLAIKSEKPLWNTVHNSKEMIKKREDDQKALDIELTSKSLKLFIDALTKAIGSSKEVLKLEDSSVSTLLNFEGGCGDTIRSIMSFDIPYRGGGMALGQSFMKGSGFYEARVTNPDTIQRDAIVLYKDDVEVYTYLTGLVSNFKSVMDRLASWDRQEDLAA